MKFSWHRRADEAQADREAAERRLKRTHDEWADVRLGAAAVRREKHLNGWTEIALAVFTPPREEGRS